MGGLRATGEVETRLTASDAVTKKSSPSAIGGLGRGPRTGEGALLVRVHASESCPHLCARRCEEMRVPTRLASASGYAAGIWIDMSVCLSHKTVAV